MILESQRQNEHAPSTRFFGAWGTLKGQRCDAERTYSAPPSPPSPAPPAAPAAPAEPAAPAPPAVPPLLDVVLEPPELVVLLVVLEPPEPPVLVVGVVPPDPSVVLLVPASSSPPQPTATRQPLTATKASRLVRFFMLRFLRINENSNASSFGGCLPTAPCAQTVPVTCVNR